VLPTENALHQCVYDRFSHVQRAIKAEMWPQTENRAIP